MPAKKSLFIFPMGTTIVESANPETVSGDSKLLSSLRCGGEDVRCDEQEERNNAAFE